MFLRCCIILAAAALLPVVFAQSHKKAAPAKESAADWPTYARDLTGDRYSPLKQIDTANTGKPTLAWSYELAPPGRGGGGRAGGRGAAPTPTPETAGEGQEAPAPAARGGEGGGRGPGGRGRGPAGPTANAEATPIVVAGIMYLPAGNRIFAFEADTGKEKWVKTVPFAVPSRGVAYWPGDKTNPPRLIFMAGSRLVAVDANTGDIDPGFGNDGVVDTKISWNGVPTIYKNIVMIGASNGEIPHGPPGDMRISTPSRANLSGPSTPFRNPASQTSEAAPAIAGKDSPAPMSGAGT